MISFALALALLLPAQSVAGAADAPLQAAHRDFAAGAYSVAVGTLRAAAAQFPQDARVQYWLARCYYELRDYNNAVMSAERAVKLDAQNSEYHQWLGRAYGGKAEETRSFFLARKVKREFEEAMRLNPANISARRDLIEYYIEAPWIAGGDKGKAQEQAEAIAALDEVQGRLARAQCLSGEKKLDQAEAEYLRVLDLAPKEVEPYFEIADFYQRRSDSARMEQVAEAAARLDPSDGRLAYYRGVVRVLAGDRLSDGEGYLKSYLASVPSRSEFPSHASALEWLGRLYEKQGKRQEAAGRYRAALQLDPDRESARASLRRIEKP